jgi:hypothetical protein
MICLLAVIKLVKVNLTGQTLRALLNQDRFPEVKNPWGLIINENTIQENKEQATAVCPLPAL